MQNRVDDGSPAGALRRQSGGRACDQADQPGDQAFQDPADSTHRRGCRYSCGDAVKGSDSARDGGSLAGAVRRQSCGGACANADAPAPHAASKDTVPQSHAETVQVIQPSCLRRCLRHLWCRPELSPRKNPDLRRGSGREFRSALRVDGEVRGNDEVRV